MKTKQKIESPVAEQAHTSAPAFLTIILVLEHLDFATQYETSIKLINAIEACGFPFGEADIVLGKLHLVVHHRDPGKLQKKFLAMVNSGEIDLTINNGGYPFTHYTYLGTSNPYPYFIDFMNTKGF